MKLSILLYLACFSFVGFAQTGDDEHENVNSTSSGEGTYKIKGKEVNASGTVEPLSGEIFLKNGQIHSTFSDLNGFNKVDYEVMNIASSNVIAFSFSAESIGINGAKLTWTGKVKGNMIEGTAERDDTGSVYHFKGPKQ